MRVDYVPVAMIGGKTVFFPDFVAIPHVSKRTGVVLIFAGLALLTLACWPDSSGDSRETRGNSENVTRGESPVETPEHAVEAVAAVPAGDGVGTVPPAHKRSETFSQVNPGVIARLQDHFPESNQVIRGTP